MTRSLALIAFFWRFPLLDSRFDPLASKTRGRRTDKASCVNFGTTTLDVPNTIRCQWNMTASGLGEHSPKVQKEYGALRRMRTGRYIFRDRLC
ncbi:hypothetical protein R3P38DRAFT_3031233 [Favolaschia claudopus]|uniref:Secreted protein n=1 Tax=Favolaschia claudopus TaxID=2862362 RepID=A0AAW0AEM8_9AGAR